MPDVHCAAANGEVNKDAARTMSAVALIMLDECVGAMSVSNGLMLLKPNLPGAPLYMRLGGALIAGG